MAGHVDQMRDRYADFDRGDIEGATQNWADDFVVRIELHGPARWRRAQR